MNSAVSRIRQSLAARRAARLGAVTFDEAVGQVCDNRCRAEAQRDRNQTAGIYGAF
jgi:hypothetical protein